MVFKVFMEFLACEVIALNINKFDCLLCNGHRETRETMPYLEDHFHTQKHSINSKLNYFPGVFNCRLMAEDGLKCGSKFRKLRRSFSYLYT